MTTDAELAELCRKALAEESGWRDLSSEGRKDAYERFQALVRRIADLTGRTYEDVMNDAVEEWVTVHFCTVPGETAPSAEWTSAGRLDP